MDGVHDMGGMHGFGPIDIESGEVHFHEDWEATVLGMTLAAGALGEWNLDQSRHARESLPPAYYLSAGYYRIWLSALENLLVENKLVSREELSVGHALTPARPVKPALTEARVEAVLQAGAPVSREPHQHARFEVGDQVLVRNRYTARHTRVPRYVRGHVGVIERVHGCHVFPDSHAIGKGEDPQWLYNVRFEATTLWGDTHHRGQVQVDLWEPYLEPVATCTPASPGKGQTS